MPKRPGLRTIQFAILYLLTLLFTSSAMAEDACPIAELSAEAGFRLDLGQFACVYADESRALTLPQILSDSGSNFAPAPNGLVDFSFGSARYWVRVKLRNAEDTAGIWWVTHDMPTADLLRVRAVAADGSVTKLLELSNDAPFYDRPIPHRHLVSSISLEPGEVTELVIDYVTGQGTQMPVMAESVAAFIERTQGETARHMMLIAMLLGMGIISTIYFYSLEGPPALFYGAYVFSIALWLAHIEGYGFQFLYPNATTFNIYAYPMVGFTSYSFGMLFVVRLTRIKHHSPRLNILALSTTALLFFMVFLAPFALSTVWYKTGGLILAVLSYMVQLVVIISAMRRGHAAGWMLFIGFLSTFVATVLLSTGYLTAGLFPQELAGSVLRVSFLIEAFAFSGAIALRVREARRARDQSLREQLRLYQESLRLSEAVRQAETDRQEAERSAEQSRAALSSAAHDIRQPLSSIQMQLSEGLSDPSSIKGSLSYIDDILRQGLENEAGPIGAGLKDPLDSGTTERFPAQLILDNITAMFAGEARSKNIDLRVINCSIFVVADPLSLMRVTSNLVSNAINHSGAKRILVGCRRAPGAVRIEVHDDGAGMTSEQITSFSKPGTKGGGSSGQGLGLSIVSKLAKQNGLGFSLESRPTRGTSGVITVRTAPYTPQIDGEQP